MCDEQIQSLQTTLHPFATGVPILLLQGVEDINPSVVESMVSVLRTESSFIMLFHCIYVAMGLNCMEKYVLGLHFSYSRLVTDGYVNNF
jgi:hypothetical protein